MGKELILNSLMRGCSGREMCSAQVRKKLDAAVAAQQITASEAEQVLGSLVQQRFVDDERFAGAFVRDKTRLSGWGRRKVEFQLKRYGIPDNVIARVLEANYPAAEGTQEVLMRLVERKMASLRKEEDERKKREKVIRFALGRGFSWEEIMEVLKHKLV